MTPTQSYKTESGLMLTLTTPSTGTGLTDNCQVLYIVSRWQLPLRFIIDIFKMAGFLDQKYRSIITRAFLRECSLLSAIKNVYFCIFVYFLIADSLLVYILVVLKFGFLVLSPFLPDSDMDTDWNRVLFSSPYSTHTAYRCNVVAQPITSLTLTLTLPVLHFVVITKRGR